MNVVVADLQVVFFLTQHNKIGKFNGIDAEVGRELRICGDIVCIDLKFFDKQIFDCFKHVESSDTGIDSIHKRFLRTDIHYNIFCPVCQGKNGINLRFFCQNPSVKSEQTC